MPTDPGIKGSVFEGLVADVNALVSSGRMSRADLEARLERVDLPYLDKKLGAACWYPIETYGRLLELLRYAEGGSRPDQYLRARGAGAAQRLIDGGLYSQMDVSVDTWGERVGKVMATLGPLMFNFGRWTSSIEEGDGLRLTAEDMGALPAVARIVIEGFIEVMAARALKSAVVVTSESLGSDSIRYTACRC